MKTVFCPFHPSPKCWPQFFPPPPFLLCFFPPPPHPFSFSVFFIGLSVTALYSPQCCHFLVIQRITCLCCVALHKKASGGQHLQSIITKAW